MSPADLQSAAAAVVSGLLGVVALIVSVRIGISFLAAAGRESSGGGGYDD